MEKTGWRVQKPMKRRKKRVPLGLVLLGLSWVVLLAGAASGCKGSSSEGNPPQKPAVSITEYWRSLFKDDPESQKEFQRIQAEFQTGKHSVAIGDLQELLKRSPQAPWAEVVEFYLSQAWTLQQKYGSALQQLDSLLDRYPKSPAVPRVWISKGQIYLAMAKQSRSSDAQDPVSKQYLEKAKEILRQVSKQVPNDPVVEAEALYTLGDVYSSLQEPAQARQAFREVAEAYADSPYAGKALYALAGVLLGEADLEGAESAFREIVDRYPKTNMAEKAGQKLEGIRLVGSQAPPLEIKEWVGVPPPEGDVYKGKLTLLSFWAIWCPHCKRNIPKMESLLETYATRGVSVLGVTREGEGEGIGKIREFVDTHPMGYPTGVDDDGKTSKAMAVKSIPCVVAVDSRGRICWHGHPDQLSDKVLEALLKSSF